MMAHPRNHSPLLMTHELVTISHVQMTPWSAADTQKSGRRTNFPPQRPRLLHLFCKTPARPDHLADIGEADVCIGGAKRRNRAGGGRLNTRSSRLGLSDGRPVHFGHVFSCDAAAVATARGRTAPALVLAPTQSKKKKKPFSQPSAERRCQR